MCFHDCRVLHGPLTKNPCNVPQTHVAGFEMAASRSERWNRGIGKWIWVRHSGGPPFRGAAIPGFSNALAAGDSDIEPIDVVAAGA